MLQKTQTHTLKKVNHLLLEVNYVGKTNEQISELNININLHTRHIGYVHTSGLVYFWSSADIQHFCMVVHIITPVWIVCGPEVTLTSACVYQFWSCFAIRVNCLHLDFRGPTGLTWKKSDLFCSGCHKKKKSEMGQIRAKKTAFGHVCLQSEHIPRGSVSKLCESWAPEIFKL